MALVCASTYDVDDEHMTEMLSSTSGASILIQAAIVVQQGGGEQNWNDRYLGLLRFRFARLLHRCYKLLAEHGEALDNAIKCSWLAYVPCTTKWVTTPGQSDHCVTNETRSLEGVARSLRYNLLSGELLVNGLPVARAPVEYHTQPLYKTLFGTATIEVMPATSTGFRYSAKRSFQAHEVQLGMPENPAKLIVQASHCDATIEIVPGGVFLKDLPEHFVQDHVHWYNFKSGDVEFRPATDPWNASSSASWTLQKVRGTGWRLIKDKHAVVGLQTASAIAISTILKPLANARRIHCVLQTTDCSLRVEIPTLRLNFTLAKGETMLTSKEFRSMAVDGKQDLGTLVGFKNKLMLKAKNGDRLLLLAEAPVVYAEQGGHISVSAQSTDTISTVHPIRVDSLLGRLVDNGDLGCKFYMAYLHALTSFCLPDPFTCTTGTEQALNILGSSAVRSFDRLSQANVNILASIAGLCPGRSYYPTDKRVMQSVTWNKKLSFLSQHARLRSSVQAIFDQAKQAAFYYPKNVLRFPNLQNVDDHLQKRDSIRSSTFRVPGYGAEEHTLHYDVEYDARDRKPSSRGENVVLMSYFMARGGGDLHWPMPTGEQMWDKLLRVGVVYGPELDHKQYRYDGSLVMPKEFDNVLAHLPLHHDKLAACQTPDERYSVTIWLATMAFAEGADMSMLQAFAMFCKCPHLLRSRPPSAVKFDTTEGKMCTYDLLEKVAHRHVVQIASLESTIARKENEYFRTYKDRRRTTLLAARRVEIAKLVRTLTSQWPCSEPTAPSRIDGFVHLKTTSVMKAAQAKFLSWHNNMLLQEFLYNIVFSLSSPGTRSVRPSMLTYEPAPLQLSPLGHHSMREIFATSSPKDIETRPRLYPSGSILTSVKQTEETFQPRLEAFLQTLNKTTGESNYEKSYASDLRSSLEALRSDHQQQSVSKKITTQQLEEYRRQCEEYATTMYREILTSINDHPNSSAERTLQHWPRMSPSLLLRHLAHDQRTELPEAWKNRIVDYGVALTDLQQSERLLRLQVASERTERNTQLVTSDGGTHALDLLNELRNPGHVNWSPREYPEYLLMEIESGIMIREVQQQIASEMRNPSVSGNAVMQLNMGEGKSTVVIPMVAAALADGSQLVRVVVAKPQSKQMAEMLISKFGGLLRRRIDYMPFSRSLQLTKPAAETMLDVLRQCRRKGGILLVQPEHILSFRLMAPECFIASNDAVGKTLIATQDFFDEHSRDIVDESDENFSVRFELIYTMGTQQPIELSLERWLLLQQLLDSVLQSAVSVAKTLPSSIEIHPGDAGAFPRVRVLRADGMQLLTLQVAADIRDNGLRGFQMSRQSGKMRKAVFDYITVLNIGEETAQFVENGDFWESSKTSILFLRGILAGGVLAFVLGNKRWRVNYGLASRSPPTKLAVPYRAKDSPSPRSEFSHPDVVIALTSLCYYYEGLKNEDMFTAFAHLVNSDQADTEYQVWLKHAPDVLQAFRQLEGVNLKDRPQCINHVFPSLRQGKAVIDYFLSHIVFLKEIRQYPHKLSASGWDIGKKKSLVTTGFSGTNDSKRLLPLFVKQLNLEQQTHTNALVLEYLLQPVNSVEIMNPATVGEQTSDAKRLLLAVLQFDPPVQVILDVGAQILELDNLNFAKTWLRLSDHGKEAAVFVNSFDELCVIDRKNRVDLLQTSPYSSRLDTCLVFLDESHTRETDLKLPATYRAAVTLGAHLTKDRLVQACMRMRKLGQGQTVVFCIPQEIQSKIIDVRPGNEKAEITVADVLLWSISETHAETRRSMPLWTVQGERFVRHEKIWTSIKKDGVTSLSKVHAEKFLDEEAQSIDHRYRPRKAESQPTHFANSEDENLRLISNRCHEFDGLSFNASTLEEEQERELSPETEAEREAPKPRMAQPAIHSLHQDVVSFALSGSIVHGSKAYMPAFESLKDTCSPAELPLLGNRKLMATADFATTIQQSQRSSATEMFQRHVQWVLTRSDNDSREVDLVLIIIPYEANALYSRITHPMIALHLYKPRCNAGYAPLDRLDLFVSKNTTPPMLPRSLSVQLGLFAGQLYVSTHADYLEICRFLGLSPHLVSSEMEKQGWQVSTDGFILSDGDGRLGGSSGLRKSPVNFFKLLLSKIRRNGDDISKTDMGGLLDGKPFHKSHWEEA